MLTTNQANYGYWTNDIPNYRRVCVLLSPGAYSGDFFNHYTEHLPKDCFCIIPDYPSRGSSSDIDNNDVNSISIFVSDLLRELKINQINIVALSYGTQVAIQMLLNPSLKINNMILVAPGEYYLGIGRIILKLVFAPFLYFPQIHTIIKKVVLKLGFMDFLPDTKLNFILKQWIGTLNYVYPSNFTSEVETIIVNYSEDRYVPKSSIVKLNKIFTNRKTVILKGKHPTTIDSFKTFFDKYFEIETTKEVDSAN